MEELMSSSVYYPKHLLLKLDHIKLNELGNIDVMQTRDILFYWYRSQFLGNFFVHHPKRH